MHNAHWQKSREIVERIVVTGELMLETPARLGNGDADGLTDMPLLLDPFEGKALLTGASIAGALRSYLRERVQGYGQKDEENTLYAHLFGGIRPEDKGIDARMNLGQLSPLIVSDARSREKPQIELRDGVKLNPQTRTAEDEKKFDLELLAAGTVFPLRFELLVTEKNKKELIPALATALQGLERGEISIGGRKRRGLGQGRVHTWQVCRYDLDTPAGLIGWLEKSGEWQTGSEIAPLLGVAADTLVDKRRRFIMQATLALETSLLIRSGSGEAAAPDMTHLHSRREGVEVPILSGASLTGALRARARRIVHTIGIEAGLIAEMFGPDSLVEPKASRVIVRESEINNGLTNLVQSRVKIDRFTGGSFPTALFYQQPVFGRAGRQTTVTLNLELQKVSNTFEAQIGLLLLLLKDLWTGDLPLGGEASVGRGRLQGLSATLCLDEEKWELRQNGETLAIETGDKGKLESFVKALQEVKL